MINSSDVEFYIQNKSTLCDFIQRGMNVDVKPSHGRVGIANQGATCYLNSLLQSLYNDVSFRNLIFSCKSDTPILLEMQRLFAHLSLSVGSSTSSSKLSESFGWSKSQSFEQHDVHEFFSVLLDALGKASGDLNNGIRKLFEVKCQDVLTCPDCGNSARSDSLLMNISVDLPDSSSPARLDELIRTQRIPEILDADNKWECSKCSQRVQASKAELATVLPDHLVVHLKRFRYDPATRRRRKLNVPVVCPEVLDMAALLMNKEGENQYQLHSVLIHTGTAVGGHYRAFIRQPNQTWLDFNDSLVTALAASDMASLFDGPGQGGEAAYKGLLLENAYMMVYHRIGTSCDAECPVPAHLAAEVESFNVDLRNIQKSLEFHKHLIEFNVYLKCGNDKNLADGTCDIEVIQDGCHVGSVTYERTRGGNRLFKVTMMIDCTQVLAFVLAKAFGAFESAGLLTSADASTIEQLNRLRHYSESSDRMGETYGGCSQNAFATFGWFGGSAASLILETRTESDRAFVEFNPREMSLKLINWKDILSYPGVEFDAEKLMLKMSLGEEGNQQQVTDSAATADEYVCASTINGGIPRLSLIISGEEKATVGSLRTAIQQALNLPSSSTINLILHNDRVTADLSEDNNMLRRDYGIWPGDEVVFEVSDSATGDVALAALKSTRKNIVLSYNNPTVAVTNSAPAVYDLSLEVSVDTTLMATKEMIVAKFSELQGVSFHIRRSCTGPQLKNDAKTIGEFGLVDQSILHIQIGKGCEVGEHMIHFDMDVLAIAEASNGGAAVPGEGIAGKATRLNAADHILSLCDIPISEKMTVLQLKQHVLNLWPNLLSESGISSTVAEKGLSSAIMPALQAPASAQCLRLRDAKGGQVSSLLRDDRILVRCLLGLADGRKLLLEVLERPEVISSDDIVLSVRTLSYEFKQLSRPVDLAISRNSSVQHLYSLLLCNYFPVLNVPGGEDDAPDQPRESKIIEVAKGFTSGAPLTLKTSSKLKWVDGLNVSDWQAPVTSLPLNLRDGAVIIARGRVDYERAKAAMKSKREAEEGAGAAGGDMGAGSGAAAVKAKASAPSSGLAKIRAMSSQGKRNRGGAEMGISIEVLTPADKAAAGSGTGGLNIASRPPQPSPVASRIGEPNELPLSPIKTND